MLSCFLSRVLSRFCAKSGEDMKGRPRPGVSLPCPSFRAELPEVTCAKDTANLSLFLLCGCPAENK